MIVDGGLREAGLPGMYNRFLRFDFDELSLP